MNEYLIPVLNACTLVTLSYIALKIRKQVEPIESLAVPILTGIAAIIMILQPFPSDYVFQDLRFVPIIMAGLRFGWVSALLSTLLPILFTSFVLHEPYWFYDNVPALLLPALISALYHSKEYKSGYATIKMFDGLKACSILFVSRLSIGYFVMQYTTAEWLWSNLVMLFISSAAIIILIAMFNDESRNSLIHRRLEMLANQDDLTHLPNLRNFLEITRNAIKRERISIMMIDIDNFKSYNDHFGHPQGDQMLREVGQMLRNSIGERDYIARYGGEEFIVMCHTTDSRLSAKNADKLCKKIANYSFQGTEDQDVHHATISIGISIGQKVNDDLVKLIQEADDALYESKNTGKNKFTLYFDVPSSQVLHS